MAKPAVAAKAQSTKRRKRSKAGASASASYETIDVAVRNATGIVVLNRPEVHNAFNQALIAEITGALRALEADPAVRLVVLAGAGKSFCAGADLNWMKEMAGYSRAQNLADAKALAAMLATLDALEKPTVARVHGSVFGGGVGLVACCDVAIGTQDAEFSCSEARLGLVPATISPYVVRAIGERAARRFFLTAERFTAAEAFRLGLLHDLALADELDARVNEMLGILLAAGPQAQAECKSLLRAISNRPIDARMIADTAQRIARVRSSPEGTEGVAAFLAKRKAAWVPREE